jgi:hypothetical protein
VSAENSVRARRWGGLHPFRVSESIMSRASRWYGARRVVVSGVGDSVGLRRLGPVTIRAEKRSKQGHVVERQVLQVPSSSLKRTVNSVLYCWLASGF